MKKPALRVVFNLMFLCWAGSAQAGNVIFFIGDGMGFEQVTAARCYAGAPFSFEEFSDQGECLTYSASSSVTDSAAAGTALATGIKVNNGVISMAYPGDGSELETLLEYAKACGKRVGLITTTYLTHATPATFGAHEPNRDRYTQIADDYLYQTKPHILFGGGANGLNVAETAAVGYQVATDIGSFNALDPMGEFLSAQFGTSYMPYEADYLQGGYPYPHLTDMVVKALDALEEDPDGFFLMVEGGMIDQACHANDLVGAVHETLEFANAVDLALAWAALHPETDTLIVVTADHETGGLSVIADNGPGAYPTVQWSTTGHTAANVPVYAQGKNADWISSVMDNTDLFAICVSAMDSRPPVITGVSAVSVTDTSAQILWTTDELADSLVDYGLDTGYGQQASDAAMTTDHAVTLPNLSPNTTYHYRVTSQDYAGNGVSDGDYTFATLPVNHPPTAAPDAYSTDEDTPLSVALPGVLDNDDDPDGNPLSALLVSGPSHGTLTLQTDGSFLYTPNENYSDPITPDSFIYRASDGALESGEAIVSITVQPVADPPTAPVLTAVAGFEAVQLSWTASSDPDGDTLSYEVYRRTEGGLYTDPLAAIAGTTFLDDTAVNETTYYYLVRALDGTGLWNDSDEKTATPSATANNAYVVQDPTVTFGVLSGADYHATQEADGFVQTLTESPRGNSAWLDAAYWLHTTADPSTVNGLVLHLGVAHDPWDDPFQVFILQGTEWINITADILADGMFSPSENPQGFVDPAGNIQVTFTDGAALKKEAPDSLSIDLLYAQITTGQPVNRDPVAVDDNATTQVNTAKSIAVLANDYDPDGDGLTVTGITQPGHGTAALNPDHTVLYTPDPQFVGSDTFTYTIRDDQGGTASGTVSVLVSSGQDFVYVADIAMSLILAGKNWKAQAAVLVQHQGGQPATGATVSGTWFYNGDPTQTDAIAITDAEGNAVFSSPPAKATSNDVFTFQVTAIDLPGSSYEPEANIETTDSISP